MSAKKAPLSADSSDDEMPAGSHLNADSSDEEVSNKKINADSSEDEGPAKTGKDIKISADSSDDEGPLDRLPPLAKDNKIAADSSDDEGPLDRNPPINSSDDEEPVNAKKKLILKKPQTNLDSSDDEGVKSFNSGNKIAKPIIGSDDSDIDDPPAQNADSPDEEASASAQSPSKSFKSKKRKIRRTVDSDSDDDDASQSQNSTSTPSQKSQNVHFTPSQSLLKNKDLYDAESSDNELPEVPYTESARNGDESGDSHEEEDMESLDAIRNNVVQKHKKSPKTERSSAKNAMMEIRSESARLTRESAVGLPYHRPKQRTLEEFLNRKKGTPEILKSIHGKKFDSEADKLLEEREKKMKEFYKSDSEDEEETEDKDYDPNENKDNPDANDSVMDEENANDVPADETKKDGVAEVKNIESQVHDSGIMSGIATSDESNGNSDESSPNSPSKDKINEQVPVQKSIDMVEADDALVNKEESLKLVLEPDTPNLESEDDEIIFSSQAQNDKQASSKAWTRLEALKSKFGDLSSLEKTLEMTPTISKGADDDFIICETEKPALSTGAQKLFSRFVSHAKACKGVQARSCKQEQRNMEQLTIVSKKVINGVEVLEEEKLDYKFDEPKEKPKENPGSSFLSVKEKLKKEMMEKRKAERIKRAEIMKINNEEGGYDDLPDEEELEVDDEELEDEEYDEEDDEEGESEPEENDIIMKDKKRIKRAFEDDEAEDEDELSESEEREEDDNDSIALEDVPKKSQFKKIVDPDLLSESSNTSDIFNKLDRIRSDAETPTLNQSKLNLTSAPSSNSSFGTLISAEPRWTPFQDRISAGTVELNSAENTLQESPTNSQLAKKKLGFEGLFDQTDPDVSDIDDVIGLCSGKFVTQDSGMSQAAGMASGVFVSQQPTKLPLDMSGIGTLERTKVDSIESQETVILGDNSRPSSRGSTNIETQDTVILTGNLEQNVSNAINSLDKMLDLDELEPENSVGHGAIESDDENEDGGIKISKKRKRRVVSDSEESDDDGNEKNDDHMDESGGEEGKEESTTGNKVEYDSDENEIKKPKFKQNLFDKRGKLKKDFFEAEAELSGASDEEVSDDEDEKGLDRLEMEEGDLDEIDDDAEAAKVGRIHQKVLLDEDQAALKLFQERFLEDGDLHTDIKRQKQFKWSGLDDNIEVGPRKDEEGMEQEEETLEKWRLEKMEREKWLKEQEKKNGNNGDQHEEDSQFFQLADRTLQRMSSKDETLNTEGEKAEKEKIFKSPPAKFGPLQPLQNLGGGLRGSFLARGEASLDKIAQFNKVKDDKVGTGAKGRNFVFAAISPPKGGGADEDDESPGGKRGKVKPPPAKKIKKSRTLDENSKGTIFNLL